MSALVFLAAMAAQTASAEGLAWKWEQAEPVRYHAESFVNVPRGFLFMADFNYQARALQVGVSSDLSCKGTSTGGGFSVDCTIDTIAIEGRAIDGEQERLDKVFANFTQSMTGATVTMKVRADGHVSSLDLKGIDTSTGRTRDSLEQMRQLMRKTLAPLAIQMPKDAVGAKPWKHKGMPLFFELLTMSGTTGGVMHKYTVDANSKDNSVFIVGEGRGNLNSQLATAGASTAGAFNMVGATQTRFDSQTGLVLYSEVSVTGTPGISSDTVMGGVRYALAAWAGQVYADGSIEGLEGRKAAAPQ